MKDTIQDDVPPGWLERTGGYAKDMTLLDYFAAHAITAILNGQLGTDLVDAIGTEDGKAHAGVTRWAAARLAYDVALEMLEERE